MKGPEKCKKNEPLPTSMRQMVLEIFHFKVRNLGYHHFVGFQPQFQLNMTSQTQYCKTMKKNESAISQESSF